MKRLKNLFFALALCAPLTAAAQDIEINAENFPDGNFRKYLFEQDYGQDGVITAAEIEGITNINVISKGISSLKGIEHFTALTDLYCHQNQLTALDVSNNTALTQLSCGSNQLTALDVSKNTALTQLVCSYNQLTVLDVSKNTALTGLNCSTNQLTALDVSKNTALTDLYCHQNQLTALDVSKNTALIWLYCFQNQLTALDVSKNTALTYLSCWSNRLTALDVSKNTALTDLDCNGNQLTALDVSNNTALIYLYCHSNQIKEEAMEALVSSLPEPTWWSGGRLYVYYEGASNEGNVITKPQVAAAKAKNWRSYYTTNGQQWTEYEGSTPTSLTISVGTDGLATYCPICGINLSSAENIAAYKASISDNTVALTRVWTVAAGEGILLRSLSGGAVEEEVPVDDDITANTDNSFIGTQEEIFLYETAATTNFVLSKVDGVVGFFKANYIWLDAGKAYLPVENYDAARGLTIVFDGTTGISEVAPAQSTADEAVYTLDGVRVTTPTKGLYIKNGKKIFVK